MNLSVQLNKVTKVFPVGSSSVGDLSAAVGGTSIKEQLTGKVAVDDVTLTLKEGDRLGIVGRNGAGKSTLLHMIAGISEPTAGDIHIDGKVTSIMTLGIGLRDDLSGRENIYVDGEIQGRSRQEIDSVIDHIIEFSELNEFIDYPVRTYSTGMKARLAFSMISHIDPEILIIDEALSVGDASFSVKATERILDICGRGKIVILVSHGMKSVRDICNRCIYLKDGKVVMDGSPDAVTQAYVDEVHTEDEFALQKAFSAHIGNRSYKTGSHIQEVSLFSGVSGTSTVRVEARERLCIQIFGSHPSEKSGNLCSVRIVRLDELVVFNEIFLLADFSTNDGKFSIEILFDPFPLAAAIYRLDIMLSQLSEMEADLCAQCSTVFEVFTMDPPSGGKPMLYYPVTATTSQF